jgi:hypothetical protein
MTPSLLLSVMAGGLNARAMGLVSNGPRNTGAHFAATGIEPASASLWRRSRA